MCVVNVMIDAENIQKLWVYSAENIDRGNTTKRRYVVEMTVTAQPNTLSTFISDYLRDTPTNIKCSIHLYLHQASTYILTLIEM